jgi:hypothetical protein
LVYQADAGNQEHCPYSVGVVNPAKGWGAYSVKGDFLPYQAIDLSDYPDEEMSYLIVKIYESAGHDVVALLRKFDSFHLKRWLCLQINDKPWSSPKAKPTCGSSCRGENRGRYGYHNDKRTKVEFF